MAGDRAGRLDQLDELAAVAVWIIALAGLSQLEGQVVSLALAVAERIIQRELEADDELAVRVVKEALAGVAGARQLRVVVSHREEVKRLPGRYRISARRPGVSIDGMEHPELPLFSFQFHPEAGEEFAHHVGLDPSCLDERVREDSRRLLGAFRRLVLEPGY